MDDLDDTDFDVETDDDSDTDTDEFSTLDRALEVTRSPSQDDVLPLLECPVCFDLPLPPIRTCIQGHIICADCCLKLPRCPLCQQRIDIGRNFFAEHFLNNSVIKCKFTIDGCRAELPGEKLKRHMQTCEFRPLKCRTCSARVAFSDFEDHMLIEHRIGRWDLDDEGIRIVKSQKQRHRNRLEPLVDNGPASIKFICITLLVTAVVTAFIDYFCHEPSLEAYDSEFTFWC